MNVDCFKQYKPTFSQILSRNHEPHSGTMFTKTTDPGNQVRKTLSACPMETDKPQLEVLLEENHSLKQSLEEVSGSGSLQSSTVIVNDEIGGAWAGVYGATPNHTC